MKFQALFFLYFNLKFKIFLFFFVVSSSLWYLDAVDGFWADGFPGFVWIHEMSILDLVFDGHVLVKRELAGKRDVDDDPRRPHVQGPVEPFLTEDVRVQDLGSEVGRSSDYWLPEGFLPDNSRVSEITQFDLATMSQQIFRKENEDGGKEREREERQRRY